MKYLPFCLLPAALLLAAAPAAAQPPEANADRAALVKGNNVFALDLYNRLREKDGNLFFSPYSISTALGMAYGGARGETADEMARTLHFALEPEKLHPAFGALVADLQGAAAKRKYQLTVANRLWGQKGYQFLPEYLKLTATAYGAGLEELDFEKATEQARKTINAWVEEKTKEKIKDLIPEGALANDTRLVLTNAIYFKAAWAEAFAEGATKPDDFEVAPGKKVKVQMMNQTELMPYFEGDGLQAVSLPYEGHDLSMVILLPKKADGLAELEKNLTSARLDGWLGKLQRRRVQLSIPKFKTTSQFELGKELAAMGMPLAFSKRADFSGITSREKLFIDKVIHKAFVDVHEKGTEAAAATAITFRPTSAPIGEPARFRADHPFVFLIRDTKTGSILFMGRVANPA